MKCLLLPGLLLFACTEFSTQFERIEDDRVRMLDFMYEPPEAAPGDTVTLRAVFAGKTVDVDDISWRVSWKVVKNIMGTDTSFEEHSLESLSMLQSDFSDHTSCIEVRFVIPDDCLLQSPMLPDDWVSLLPDELRDSVPEQFASMSKSEMVQLVDSLATVATTLDAGELVAVGVLVPDLVAQLPLVTQLCTVPVRLFADVAGAHRIQSDYTVGYTTKFARWPGANVFANTNPRINSAGVYKVEGNGLVRFDRESDKSEFIQLYPPGEDTVRIPVDKGYSYFVAVVTGRRDTVYTIGDIMNGQPPERTEEHSAEWMFRMDPDETDGLSHNDFMNIASLNDVEGILLPPRKSEIRHFTIWVQVTDSKLGVLNRSQGSVLAEMQGVFEYTDEYLGQFEK